MEWLASQGAHIYVPLGHSPDVDLIAELEGRLVRVEVKTTSLRAGDRWKVMIATRGGNRSWDGMVKYFDIHRCDHLFVAVADGRRWFIPTHALDCRSNLALGGKKYAEFEVESGRPFHVGTALESLSARGSAGVGEPGRSVKSVATPEWVRFPPPPLATAPQGSADRVGPVRLQRTRISGKHQVTIPSVPFRAAGLEVGDRLHATADGAGRVVLERLAPSLPPTA